MAEDYYATLGLKKGASTDEIQKAYREMARKYHPDMNPDDASAKSKFQEIQKAYEVLSDPEKREMFDRYGSGFENAQQGHGPQGWPGGAQGGFQDVDLSDLFREAGGGATGGGAGGFGDFFRQFTGGGGGRATGAPGQRRQPPKGADIEHQMEVPFRSAVSGGEAQVTVRRAGNKLETISVKIPEGIADGKKIRLRGQGEPGPRGGQAGDILITVKVASHPNYQRIGDDLVIKVPVTIAEAALGGKIDVPTPKGTITLTVPAGTSSGKRLRIKGHGVKTKSGAGDLFAEIQIAMPIELDERSNELIREFDRLNSHNPRSGLAW